MPGSSRPNDDTDDRHTVIPRQSNIQGMHKWSTSPNELPAWMQVLHKHLMDNTKYRTLIQYSYVVERRIVCCLSTNHIDRIRNKLIRKGTPVDPCNISRNDVTPIPGITPPPPGPPPSASTPSASAPGSAPPSKHQPRQLRHLLHLSPPPPAPLTNTPWCPRRWRLQRRSSPRKSPPGSTTRMSPTAISMPPPMMASSCSST